jgi:cytochrome c oxidase subunit 1
MVSGLLGKNIASTKAALWVPYLWTLGVCTFSTGLFIGGLRGEPRRTNMGLTYLNPDSPAFRPDWVNSSHIGVLGGIIMTLAVLLFFYVFFKTLFARTTQNAQSFAFLSSEAYHDEDVGFVKNLGPWIIAAVCAVLLAYAQPLYDAATKTGGPGSPRFSPSSPVAEPPHS